MFYEKKLQKKNQKDLRIEKVINRKNNKLSVKLKGYNNLFNIWRDEKGIVEMSEYFLNPNFLEANLKDLSTYAIKIDLKNVTEVYTSSFAKKIDLANLKSNVHKLDINKLGKVSTGPNSLKSKEDK